MLTRHLQKAIRATPNIHFSDSTEGNAPSSSVTQSLSLSHPYSWGGSLWIYMGIAASSLGDNANLIAKYGGSTGTTMTKALSVIADWYDPGLAWFKIEVTSLPSSEDFYVSTDSTINTFAMVVYTVGNLATDSGTTYRSGAAGTSGAGILNVDDGDAVISFACHDTTSTTCVYSASTVDLDTYRHSDDQVASYTFKYGLADSINIQKSTSFDILPSFASGGEVRCAALRLRGE